MKSLRAGSVFESEGTNYAELQTQHPPEIRPGQSSGSRREACPGLGSGGSAISSRTTWTSRSRCWISAPWFT